ncbi:hypothetical protein EDC96DRAFT_550369 [Choanephora cucurbitarum]|nr:hypothetical protein EDC96DRAFT_550369 [Choanephora cucurbitarum]
MLKGLPVESAKQVKCLLNKNKQLLNNYSTTDECTVFLSITLFRDYSWDNEPCRQLHFEGVRLLVKKTNDMFRQPDRQRIYLIRFDYSILGILNDLLRYLIGCIPSFLNRLTLEMLYDSLFFLHVDRNGYLFNTLLKMINYIQFVKEVIEYSGSNCVDHLTYLHMSTESVKGGFGNWL